MLVSPSSRRGMQFIHKTFLPRLTIAKSKQAQSHVLIAKVESKHAARSTMKCMDSRIENFEEISLFIAESTPSLLEERSATVSSDSLEALSYIQLRCASQPPLLRPHSSQPCSQRTPILPQSILSKEASQMALQKTDKRCQS